tara:strand:+ start:870 stop:1181 length:312 start_codon:yes stop_codon:yes gene_type:complete
MQFEVGELVNHQDRPEFRVGIVTDSRYKYPDRSVQFRVIFSVGGSGWFYPESLDRATPDTSQKAPVSLPVLARGHEVVQASRHAREAPEKAKEHTAHNQGLKG